MIEKNPLFDYIQNYKRVPRFQRNCATIALISTVAGIIFGSLVYLAFTKGGAALSLNLWDKLLIACPTGSLFVATLLNGIFAYYMYQIPKKCAQADEKAFIKMLLSDDMVDFFDRQEDLEEHLQLESLFLSLLNKDFSDSQWKKILCQFNVEYISDLERLAPEQVLRIKKIFFNFLNADPKRFLSICFAMNENHLLSPLFTALIQTTFAAWVYQLSDIDACNLVLTNNPLLHYFLSEDLIEVFLLKCFQNKEFQQNWECLFKLNKECFIIKYFELVIDDKFKSSDIHEEFVASLLDKQTAAEWSKILEQINQLYFQVTDVKIVNLPQKKAGLLGFMFLQSQEKDKKNEQKTEKKQMKFKRAFNDLKARYLLIQEEMKISKLESYLSF